MAGKWYEITLRVKADSKKNVVDDVIQAIDYTEGKFYDSYVWGDVREVEKSKLKKVV